MNENQFVETEQLADRVLMMADSWMRSPLANTVAIEDDHEFQRLTDVKEEVKHRKYSILRHIDMEGRWKLTRRHPVWITEYDLSILQLEKATPSSNFPGDHVGLECSLTPSKENPLKTFYWCGGALLRINTMQIHLAKRTHAEDPTIWEVLKSREMAQRGLPLSGEFCRRDAVQDGEHSWLFVGSRWDCSDNILNLDFGRHSDEINYFISTMKKQWLEHIKSQ